MILSLFLVLLGITLFLIALGYTQKGKADIYKYVGFVFLFLLGVMLIPGTPGDLEYKTGTTEFYVYGDNWTGYHWDYEGEPGPSNNDIYLFHIVEENVYSTYTSFTYGFYIALLSVFGFIQTLTTRREEDFSP